MQAASEVVKFHMSLNVSDLNRSIAFYRTLFGIEPAKRKVDYAKFEPVEPPLVLSLEPMPRNPGGSLNHVGIRVRNAQELVAMQSRLEAAGLATDREDGVECCYSKQTKFWVHDPDRVLWEIYLLDEEPGDGCAEPKIPSNGPTKREPVVESEPQLPWEHRLGDAVPERLDAADASMGDVRLSGTLNSDLSEADLQRLRSEVLRVLTPGGSVSTHGLVADRSFPNGLPKLPGPASVVRKIPTEMEVLEWLRDGGFVDVRITKLSPAPYFRHDGVEMRELRAAATKPLIDSNGPVSNERFVIYKGPFRELADDDGRRYPRGQRVAVPAAVAQSLGAGPFADAFVFPPAPEVVTIQSSRS